MQHRFRVAPGNSILLNYRRKDDPRRSHGIAVPGEIVTADMIGPNVEEFVQQGRLIPVAPTEAPAPDDSARGELSPGAEIKTIVLPSSEAEPGAKIGLLAIKDATQEAPKGPPPGLGRSRLLKGDGKALTARVFDPEKLKAKSIDELNILVLEVDPDIQPFETSEEAIAWLSIDFHRAQA